MPTNPILSGFHPDPSVCRVGDEYFLVTSSFGYFPGIPVHRSRDLQTWELVGHVLGEDNWIAMDELALSDGVWAPTIRHHDGTFYVVFAMAKGHTGAETYLCTATDPRGPWTRRVVAGADGIDPSLFFDTDGRCWMTAARDSTTATATGPAEIWLSEIDLHAARLTGEQRIIWHGALTGQWVEAPHLYLRGDTYYLVCAEGGTERNHAVTAATAAQITGPYRTDPRSPLLTHRHLDASEPVQNVGHADLVDAVDGSTWAVLLAVRPIGGHHTLGRESFLVPVTWEDAGPVFAPGTGRVILDPPAGAALDLTAGVSPRGPVDAAIAAASVTLEPSPIALSATTGRPAMLAWRQDAHEASFSCTLATTQLDAHEAGITVFQNERHHAELFVSRTLEGIQARARLVVDGVARELGSLAVTGDVSLEVVAELTQYRLTARDSDGASASWGVPHTALSTEAAGGFLGVLFGIVNRAPAASDAVRFDDIRYAHGTAATRSDAAPRTATPSVAHI